MINNKYKIIDAAFVLSLKNGFDNVSIKQIQEESGISIGSIYFHFKNKDEILICIIKTYFIKSVEQYINDVKKFDGSFIEKLNFAFKYKISRFSTKLYMPPYTVIRPKFDPKEFFMMTEGIFHQNNQFRHLFYGIYDDLYDFYFELIQEAVENKEIRDDIDIKTLVMFIQTCLKGYVDLWVFQPNFSIEELIDSNIKMIWEAVKR